MSGENNECKKDLPFHWFSGPEGCEIWFETHFFTNSDNEKEAKVTTDLLNFTWLENLGKVTSNSAYTYTPKDEQIECYNNIELNYERN
jgi:hypothetical protein